MITVAIFGRIVDELVPTTKSPASPRDTGTVSIITGGCPGRMAVLAIGRIAVLKLGSTVVFETEKIAVVATGRMVVSGKLGVTGMMAPADGHRISIVEPNPVVQVSDPVGRFALTRGVGSAVGIGSGIGTERPVNGNINKTRTCRNMIAGVFSSIKKVF